jgi:hypothetical protein
MQWHQIDSKQLFYCEEETTITFKSYQTPIAWYNIATSKLIVTTKKYSKTTTKHCNKVTSWLHANGYKVL